MSCSLSGQEHDAAMAAAGMTVFVDNCAACHMEDGIGRPHAGRAQPDRCDLALRRHARGDHGIGHQRPFWRDARTGTSGWREDEIRAVAFYVHGLGGGE